jgi:predicted aspartyl protease
MRTAIVANSHAGRDARCSSTAKTTPPDRPPRRVPAAVAAALLSLVLAGAAGAQTGPDNLPPAPGVLERELSLPPLSKPDAAASGSGPRLSSPIEIPFILEGGHIIVEASINGGSPKPFMFDTGASNIITPDIAEPLHAPVVRTERTGGFGPQVTRADVIRVDRIAIGAAALDHPTVTVMELQNTLVDRGSRPRLAGLLGAELLAHYAVTIDYGSRTLTLNNPGKRPPSGAISLPLGFSISRDGLNHPSITAELEGNPGDFVIDTGSGGQVFVSEKFQNEHAPFAQYGKVLTFLGAGGIGGHVSNRLAFGKRLGIGPLTLSPPFVNGPADSASFNLRGSNSPHIAGVIGVGILSQFIVTIDYQSAHAYFEPVPGRKLPAVFQGTGMIFDKPDHEWFEVLDVLKDTAAERMGLHRGDHIVEVAGRPARELSFSDVQVLSAAPAHTSLTVRTSDHRLLTLAVGQILP